MYLFLRDDIIMPDRRNTHILYSLFSADLLSVRNSFVAGLGVDPN